MRDRLIVIYVFFIIRKSLFITDNALLYLENANNYNLEIIITAANHTGFTRQRDSK